MLTFQEYSRPTSYLKSLNNLPQWQCSLTATNVCCWWKLKHPVHIRLFYNEFKQTSPWNVHTASKLSTNIEIWLDEHNIKTFQKIRSCLLWLLINYLTIPTRSRALEHCTDHKQWFDNNKYCCLPRYSPAHLLLARYYFSFCPFHCENGGQHDWYGGQFYTMCSKLHSNIYEISQVIHCLGRWQYCRLQTRMKVSKSAQERTRCCI